MALPNNRHPGQSNPLVAEFPIHFLIPGVIHSLGGHGGRGVPPGLGGVHGLLLLELLLAHGELGEPGVLEGVVGADAVLGAQDEHALQQVDAELVDLGQDGAQVLGGVHLDVGLVLGELGDAGPGALGGRAHDAEDADDLVLVGGAGEQRPPRVHLGHDAARRPDVDAGVVRPAAQQHVGRAVPQRHHLVGEGVDGDAEGARQPKVAELERALPVDKQVLRFQISVEDSILVAEVDAPQQLVHEGLDGGGLQRTPVAVGVHVLLQVAVHKLEDEHELVLGVDDVVEGDYVLVFQLLHERNLADRGRRRAFFRVEMDFLESDELTRLTVASLEDLYAAPI